VIVPITGVSGVVNGVTEADSELAEFPVALVATTLTEYETPLVSPEMKHPCWVVVQVIVVAPSVADAVYPVMADPPSKVGTDQFTPAAAFARTTPRIVGAPGVVAGVAAPASALAESPAALVATTPTSKVDPLVRPCTEHDIVTVVHDLVVVPSVAVAV
jgi:hypothetical protein